jgi:hypothetical protein
MKFFGADFPSECAFFSAEMLHKAVNKNFKRYRYW